MTRIQNFAIGILMVTLAIAAFFHVYAVGPLLRILSVAALGTAATVAALIFLAYALVGKDRGQT